MGTVDQYLQRICILIFVDEALTEVFQVEIAGGKAEP
jgi:hypothetical protein